MKVRIFMGTKMGTNALYRENGSLKRIKHEGKEYVGLILDKPYMTLVELEEEAKKIPVDIQKLTIFPLELFG